MYVSQYILDLQRVSMRCQIIFIFSSVLYVSMAASEKLKLIDNFSTATNNNNDNISRDELRLIQFTEDYNIHSYPKPIENETLPLNVEFQINLRNVLEVNEVSQICTLEPTIRLFWKDSRVSLRQKMYQSIDS